MEQNSRFPIIEVRLATIFPDDGRDADDITVTGRQIAPGLAVVDLRANPLIERHWAVVSTTVGTALLGEDLCERCALAAAEMLGAAGDWTQSDEGLRTDVSLYEGIVRAREYGPCYPPPGIPGAGMLRVVGHTPGEPYRHPSGMPDAMGLLAPQDVPDDRLPTFPDELSRPWYEREV